MAACKEHLFSAEPDSCGAGGGLWRFCQRLPKRWCDSLCPTSRHPNLYSSAFLRGLWYYARFHTLAYFPSCQLSRVEVGMVKPLLANAAPARVGCAEPLELPYSLSHHRFVQVKLVQLPGTYKS